MSVHITKFSFKGSALLCPNEVKQWYVCLSLDKRGTHACIHIHKQYSLLKWYCVSM